MRDETSKQNIIYIMGAARSGSTLLDIILGNQNGIRSVGELNRYPKRGGNPPQKEQHSEQANFWQQIKTVFSDKEIKDQKTIFDTIEYHSGLIKRLVRGEKLPQSYIQFNQQLIQTIFQNIEEHTIIDCSKYPGRALSYPSFSEGRNLHFIYLKRHPVSVIRSFQKKGLEQPPKHWFKAMIYYRVVNTLDKIVFKKLSKKHKVIEVSYEALTNDPITTLNQIEQKFGIDFTLLKEKIQTGDDLEVGNLFDGNRIRLKPTLKIQNSKIPATNSFKEKLVWFFNRALYSN